MSVSDKLIKNFENLTGEKHSNVRLIKPIESDPFIEHNGISFNQFNELLLLFGFDRIKIYGFFQFLVNGRLKLVDGIIDENSNNINARIKSFDHLEESVINFQILALLYYGNIKMAFNELSTNLNKLIYFLKHAERNNEITFTERSKPISELIGIPADKTFYLGHLLSSEVEKLENKSKTKADELLIEEWKKWTDIGKINFNNYLTYDILDIYVATSMRDRHEYYMINQISHKIFNGPLLNNYKLRYFDPTQAYCPNRIDKGLSEALMLKRAKGTLYLVQETDTLGKDSELASTLAQGKPVIAYVPQGNKEDLNELVEAFRKMYSESDESILMKLLNIFAPNLAWDKNEVKIKEWIIDNKSINKDELEKLVLDKMKKHYDKRADLLRKDHPLGIQVNLETGVANGLLVVRTIENCSELLKNVLLNNFHFKVSFGHKKGEENYLFLHETISDSIFRIITGNDLLSNSFWNFYINSKE